MPQSVEPSRSISSSVVTNELSRPLLLSASYMSDDGSASAAD
jgi:hypothetical protein